jgi:chemotaxis protein CheD
MVLGSRICGCIPVPRPGAGGMNHFMLSEEAAGGSGAGHAANGGVSSRYGAYALESLVNALLKRGAWRERLEARLFGGARLLASMMNLGLQNIAQARGVVEH